MVRWQLSRSPATQVDQPQVATSASRRRCTRADAAPRRGATATQAGQFACYSGGRPPISTSRRGTPGSTRRSSGHQSTRASGARRRTSISGPPGPAGQRGWGGWTDRRSAPRSTRARGGRRRTSTSRPATAGSRQQRAPSARPRAPPGAGQTTCTSHGAARW